MDTSDLMFVISFVVVVVSIIFVYKVPRESKYRNANVLYVLYMDVGMLLLRLGVGVNRAFLSISGLTVKWPLATDLHQL